MAKKETTEEVSEPQDSYGVPDIHTEEPEAPPELPDIDISNDKEVIGVAVEWVVAQTDGITCPFTGQTYGFDDDKPKALTAHLKKAQSERVMFWYMNPELGPDAMNIVFQRRAFEVEFAEVEGFEIEDNNINPSFNHVPTQILKKLAASGDYGRWIAPGNFRRAFDRGYRPVPTPDGMETPHDHNHEDGRLMSRERTYMVQPRAKRESHLRRLRRETEDRTQGLDASIEQGHRGLSDPGKRTYDHFIERGMSHVNSMVVARQAELKGESITPPIQGQSVQHG